MGKGPKIRIGVGPGAYLKVDRNRTLLDNPVIVRKLLLHLPRHHSPQRVLLLKIIKTEINKVNHLRIGKGLHQRIQEIGESRVVIKETEDDYTYNSI